MRVVRRATAPLLFYRREVAVGWAPDAGAGGVDVVDPSAADVA